MFKKRQNQRPGFTMIEIVVVIFIVSVGILGVMSLIVQNVKSQAYNKNSLIASQLAQEGIEMMRMVRDTNWLTNSQFNNNLGGSGVGRAYFMDYTDVVPRDFNGNSLHLKLIVDSQGFYHDYDYSSGTVSGFYREIIVSRPTDHSLKVNCTVSWQERGQSHSYTLETKLYDWK